jgi:hypothetical protein
MIKKVEFPSEGAMLRGLLYYPSELFDEASRVQTEFLKKWL